MFAQNIGELIIYQIAVELAKDVNELVTKVPFSWKNEDVKQVKRSSSSAPSNIAEGFSQRFYPRKFIHYLNISKASSDETINHLIKLQNSRCLDEEDANIYINRYKDLSVRTLNFINYLKKKHNIRL